MSTAFTPPEDFTEPRWGVLIGPNGTVTLVPIHVEGPQMTNLVRSAIQCDDVDIARPLPLHVSEFGAANLWYRVPAPDELEPQELNLAAMFIANDFGTGERPDDQSAFLQRLMSGNDIRGWALLLLENVEGKDYGLAKDAAAKVTELALGYARLWAAITYVARKELDR